MFGIVGFLIYIDVFLDSPVLCCRLLLTVDLCTVSDIRLNIIKRKRRLSQTGLHHVPALLSLGPLSDILHFSGVIDQNAICKSAQLQNLCL